MVNRVGAFVSFGERRHGVACPRCHFVPLKGQQWSCGPDGCGYLFDTFETHAHCPQCEAQFTWTWCPQCHEGSPHAAWYQHAAAN